MSSAAAPAPLFFLHPANFTQPPALPPRRLSPSIMMSELEMAGRSDEGDTPYPINGGYHPYLPCHITRIIICQIGISDQSPIRQAELCWRSRSVDK